MSLVGGAHALWMPVYMLGRVCFHLGWRPRWPACFGRRLQNANSASGASGPLGVQKHLFMFLGVWRSSSASQAAVRSSTRAVRTSRESQGHVCACPAVRA